MSKPSSRPAPLWVLPLFASAAAWGVLFAALPPASQDFPLNDDWAFARGVFEFAKGAGIHYSGWASMPQLGQWLWACPFVWVLGESHFALRCSTVLLSWAALGAFYDLLRQEEVTSARAALAVAVLAFNPFFFLLQGTFMTDVPSLALALVALALYGRALHSSGGGWLAAACAVATLAVVSRQNTVAVSAVAAVLVGRQPALRRRPGWWLAVLLPAVAGFAVQVWFQGRPDVRALKPSLPPPAVLLSLPFITVHACGLSLLPLLLLEPRVRSWKTLAVALAVMGAAAGYWLLYGAYLPYGGLFPYTENMLTPWGAFAGSKSTGLLVVGDRPLLLGTAARAILSLLGCVGGAVLLCRAIESWRPGAWARPLLLFTAFQVLFVLIVPDFYDRYLLFLLPGTIGLALRPVMQPTPDEPGRPLLGRVAALGAVAVLTLLSVGLMHDWLSWNAARWELGRRALAKHIDPLDIEGGVEWDGWYTAATEGRDRPASPQWPVLPFTHEWFSAVSGHYALSFSELRGARTLDAEPYTAWLLPGRRRFFLLELPPRRPSQPEPGSPPDSERH